MKETIYSKYLKAYKEQHFLTNEQLGKQLGIATSSVSRILNGSSSRIQTDTKERIVRLLKLDSIELTEEMMHIQKPILGVVKAGYDLFCDENIEGYQTVTSEDDAKGDFFLRVVGDSMELARIHDHDLLYVKQCQDIPSGSIGIVMIGEEVTVKRIIKKTNLLILEAANPNVDNRYFTPEEVNTLPVKIIGRVIYSRHDFI